MPNRSLFGIPISTSLINRKVPHQTGFTGKGILMIKGKSPESVEEVLDHSMFLDIKSQNHLAMLLPMDVENAKS